jgi:hypothetical protein
VLFHRNDPELAMDLAGSATTWIWIHVVLLGALAALAHAVRVLLAGVDGVAAAVARALLPVALVTYAAFDALVGLGTGVLVERADSLGPDAHRLVEHWWAVPSPISIIATVAQLSWVTVLGATAIARSTRGAPQLLVPVLIALAGSFPLLHIRPIGLLPVALLAAALWIDDRSNAVRRRSGARAVREVPSGDWSRPTCDDTGPSSANVRHDDLHRLDRNSEPPGVGAVEGAHVGAVPLAETIGEHVVVVRLGSGDAADLGVVVWGLGMEDHDAAPAVGGEVLGLSRRFGDRDADPVVLDDEPDRSQLGVPVVTVRGEHGGRVRQQSGIEVHQGHEFAPFVST